MSDLFAEKNIKPMLIGVQGEPFDDADFIYELKIDGERCIAYLDPTDGTELRNKRNMKLLPKVPELAELQSYVNCCCILDGELAIMEAGKPVFFEIQRRSMMSNPLKIQLAAQKTPATFVAFDILYLRDHPVNDLPLMERKRLLAQKAALLKDHRDDPAMLSVLPEFNQRMAQTGAVLIHTRARYLRELAQRAAAHHAAFSDGRETLCLRYQTVSTIEDPFAPLSELCARLQAHQASHHRAELESGQCLSGPHKDDFEATINELSVKAFGSQGQTRTAAISLKLAERDIFAADTGEMPVLLLDDVLSELDAGRQDFVVNQIQSGQVFITCCDPARVTNLGKTIQIENGRSLS